MLLRVVAIVIPVFAHGFTLNMDVEALKLHTYLENASYLETEDGHIGIGIQENEYEYNKTVDLLIPFNMHAHKEFNTVLGNYEVVQQRFVFDSKTKQLGSSSGKFYQLQGGLILRPGAKSWLYNDQHAGDFTIEFWMRPMTLSNGEVVFKRYGPVIENGKIISHSGIICSIKNRRVRWSFHDIFHHPKSILHKVVAHSHGEMYTHKNRFATIEIEAKDSLQKNEWSHHALSYRSLTGQMTYYINGKAAQTLFITESMQAGDTVLIPRFYPQERSSLVIGEGYIGYLDEFMISKVARRPLGYFAMQEGFMEEAYFALHTEKYKAVEGSITSSVYDLQQGGSYLKQFTMNVLQEEDSVFILQVRMQDKFFTSYASDDQLAWVTVNKSSFLLPHKDIQGRYFQWRALLKSNHNNSRTPILKGIGFDFFIDKDPKVPVGLKAIARDEKIILQWEGNTENDLQGYRIYYSKEKRSVIFAHEAIEVRLTDLENTRYPEYTLTHLERNQLYYFAVTAIDKHNHESSASEHAFILTS